jgi:hypothetical protein
VVRDEISLPLETLSPGEYWPVVGLYELKTGQRLTVPGIPANEVTLEPIRVAEE